MSTTESAGERNLKIENQLTFGKVMGKSRVSCFLTEGVSLSLLTMRKWNNAVLYTCHNFNW